VSATMFSDYEQGPKIKGKTSLYLFVIYLYIYIKHVFSCTAITYIQIKNTKKNTKKCVGFLKTIKTLKHLKVVGQN